MIVNVNHVVQDGLLYYIPFFLRSFLFLRSLLKRMKGFYDHQILKYDKFTICKYLHRFAYKYYESTTIVVNFSSESNAFHSEKLSFPIDLPSVDISTSIILSIWNARGLNLYCWESLSFLVFAWIFMLTQRLENSLNILCKSWFRTYIL